MFLFPPIHCIILIVTQMLQPLSGRIIAARNQQKFNAVQMYNKLLFGGHFLTSKYSIYILLYIL